ncbi:P-loop NTPase [Luteipulveratus sp. YIM 133132]|uniref:AAA family ATPase n=1 Tax=Luteipulveratus flavus TaxID=3031728 RepID=UPI0023B0882B|nr:P-loop NTPase [Luteipulveratus sp. YIM 133132]MDE9367736.1 P-loop NTPase [Luteipulveratus sp. YIM 133132]
MSATTVLTAVSPRLEAQVATRLEAARGLRLVRRCADVEDLLAAGAANVARTAVVSADLPGLDRTVVADLRAAGVLVAGTFVDGAEEDQRRLRQIGVERLLPLDAPAADWDQTLTPPDAAAAPAAPSSAASPAPAAGDADADIDAAISRELLGEAPVLRRAGASPAGSGSAAAGSVKVVLPAAPEPDEESSVPHRVIAVWGPTGAPGRTTVAVNLAAEIARLGRRVVLVDADTYGASVAQHLALLDEAPGVAAAARLADAGSLDRPRLAATAPEVSPGLRVLTGLPRADRWTELREDAFVEVLQQCRTLAQVTVVDVGFCLEEDEELSYDTRAPRRNAATTAALREADDVLAVGAADPVGLQRLVRGLDDLRAFTSTPCVVVTKVRAAAVGGAPERRILEALDRFAGVSTPVLVPDDRAALDAAMLAGRTLAETAAGSPARRALAALAGELTGVEVALRRRGGLGSRRGRRTSRA